MKRWLLLAAATVALPIIALACGDDSTSGNNAKPDSGSPTATITTPSATTTTTTAGDAGPSKRTGCLDRPTDVERPDRLPCNLIPPGVTLP